MAELPKEFGNIAKECERYFPEKTAMHHKKTSQVL